jgi:predicted RNA binding protein YcfA (HicA-like mRNA interferase family)
MASTIDNPGAQPHSGTPPTLRLRIESGHLRRILAQRTENRASVLDMHIFLCIWADVSKAKKLLAKIMDPSQIHNVRFAEAVAVLEGAGFVWDLGSGSHQVFRHPDGRRITLPRHGSDLKPAYVRQIRALIQP